MNSDHAPRATEPYNRLDEIITIQFRLWDLVDSSSVDGVVIRVSAPDVPAVEVVSDANGYAEIVLNSGDYDVETISPEMRYYNSGDVFHLLADTTVYLPCLTRNIDTFLWWYASGDWWCGNPWDRAHHYLCHFRVPIDVWIDPLFEFHHQQRIAEVLNWINDYCDETLFVVVPDSLELSAGDHGINVSKGEGGWNSSYGEHRDTSGVTIGYIDIAQIHYDHPDPYWFTWAFLHELGHGFDYDHGSTEPNMNSGYFSISPPNLPGAFYPLEELMWLRAQWHMPQMVTIQWIEDFSYFDVPEIFDTPGIETTYLLSDLAPLSGGAIEQRAEGVYVLHKALRIVGNDSLVVAAGMEVLFDPGIRLHVSNGALAAIGTAESPVYFGPSMTGGAHWHGIVGGTYWYQEPQEGGYGAIYMSNCIVDGARVGVDMGGQGSLDRVNFRHCATVGLCAGQPAPWDWPPVLLSNLSFSDMDSAGMLIWYEGNGITFSGQNTFTRCKVGCLASMRLSNMFNGIYTDCDIAVLSDSGSVPVGENFLTGVGIAVQSAGAGTIDATNSWWGTTDTTAIPAMIWDSHDDPTLGTVNYIPILLAPTGSYAGVQISDSVLDFGEVLLSDTIDMTFHISNTGTAALVITRSELPASITSNMMVPSLIAPGDSLAVDLCFHPDSARHYAEHIEINSNAPTSPTWIPVLGQGIWPQLVSDQQELQFGFARTNDTTAVQISLRNSGSAPVTITNAILANPAFSCTLGAGTMLAQFMEPRGVTLTKIGHTQRLTDVQHSLDEIVFTLQPGDSQYLDVFFMPNSETLYEDSLTVYSDRLLPLLIPVVGTGAAPHLTVEPSILDYGEVRVGSEIGETVLLGDTGYWDLQVTSLNLVQNEVFFLEPLPTMPDTIAARGTMTYMIQCAPTDTGIFLDTLLVSHDAGDLHRIPLRTVGVQGTLVFQPESIMFDTVRLLTEGFIGLQVMNIGTSPVTILDMVASDSAFQAFLPSSNLNDELIGSNLALNQPTKSTTVRAVPSELDEVSFEVGVGDSQLVIVRFVPAQEIAYDESLTVFSDLPTRVIRLTGTGAAPHLSVSPQTLDFGYVRVNAIGIRTVTLENTGYWDLQVQDLHFNFTNIYRVVPVPDFPDTVYGQSAREYVIQFQPSTPGLWGNTLSIIHDGGPMIQVPVTGRGAFPVIAVEPETLQFGSVWIERSTAESLVVRNLSHVELSVSDIESNNPHFPSLPTPFTVAPDSYQSVPYPITIPDTIGYSAILTLHSDAGSPVVPLVAHGIWTELQCNPSRLDLENIAIADTVDTTIELQSVGNAGLVVDTVYLTSPEFSVTSISGDSIGAYGTQSIVIRFIGSEFGNYVDSLTIENSAGPPVRIQLTASVSVSARESHEVPDHFFLDQNFPNPFNPSTTIRFGIPNASIVEIVVYDIMGRAVVTLVSGTTEPGVHSITWNCSDCPSGMYLVRMVTGNQVSLKKMLLMK